MVVHSTAMANPFDLAWSLLKGISYKDGIEWIKHYQSQHEEDSKEWWEMEDKINSMQATGGAYHPNFFTQKYGPPPVEYTEIERKPPPGFKPLTPEQARSITLEQIDPNQE